MSDEPGKEVVNWEQELAKDAVAAAAIARPTAQNVSLRAGMISLNGQAAPGNKLQAIVLASIRENDWWPERFDANDIKAPDCFSYSPDGKDMVPHEASSKIQGSACKVGCCPQADWGSDANSPSGKGKACKWIVKIALVPTTGLQNDNTELAIVRIPVMSVPNWNNYVSKLATVLKRPPYGVVTEIGTMPDPKSQFKVTFKEVSLVEEQHLAAIKRRQPLALEVLTTIYEKNADGSMTDKTEAVVKNRKYKA